MAGERIAVAMSGGVDSSTTPAAPGRDHDDCYGPNAQARPEDSAYAVDDEDPGAARCASA
jgi:tRNA U34 2-thiouridine synthase MnmA/TrmU